MELIHWHDSFSVGVQKIDIQHQKLFNLLNELIGAFNNNRPGEAFDSILNEEKWPRFFEQNQGAIKMDTGSLSLFCTN